MNFGLFPNGTGMVIFTRNMTNNEPHDEKQDKALMDALIHTQREQ
jgi:hypothetical protein